MSLPPSYHDNTTSILLKIEKGTVTDSGSSMCATCLRGTVIKGTSASHEVTFCNMIERRITFHVNQCGSYRDSRLPSLSDMEDVAWILRTSRSRKIGFESPTERRKREKED